MPRRRSLGSRPLHSFEHSDGSSNDLDLNAAVEPTSTPLHTNSNAKRGPSLPPLNLEAVPRVDQATYENVEIVKPHTTQVARVRRRSMSDLKSKRQREYDQLVKDLGIASKKAEVDDKVEKVETPRNLPPMAIVSVVKESRKECARPSPLPKTLIKRQSFYSKLSEIDKPTIMTDAPPTQMSPTATYVSNTRELNIVPNTIISTVVDSVERDGQVRLSGARLGDDMAIALASSMLSMFVLTVDVSKNHITDKGVCALIAVLDPHVVQELNFAFVKLKRRPADELKALIGEVRRIEPRSDEQRRYFQLLCPRCQLQLATLVAVIDSGDSDFGAVPTG